MIFNFLKKKYIVFVCLCEYIRAISFFSKKNTGQLFFKFNNGTPIRFIQNLFINLLALNCICHSPVANLLFAKENLLLSFFLYIKFYLLLSLFLTEKLCVYLFWSLANYIIATHNFWMAHWNFLAQLCFFISKQIKSKKFIFKAIHFKR
jgi:hypothetical protein